MKNKLSLVLVSLLLNSANGWAFEFPASYKCQKNAINASVTFPKKPAVEKMRAGGRIILNGQLLSANYEYEENCQPTRVGTNCAEPDSIYFEIKKPVQLPDGSVATEMNGFLWTTDRGIVLKIRETSPKLLAFDESLPCSN